MCSIAMYIHLGNACYLNRYTQNLLEIMHISSAVSNTVVVFIVRACGVMLLELGCQQNTHVSVRPSTIIETAR